MLPSKRQLLVWLCRVACRARSPCLHIASPIAHVVWYHTQHLWVNKIHGPKSKKKQLNACAQSISKDMVIESLVWVTFLFRRVAILNQPSRERVIKRHRDKQFDTELEYVQSKVNIREKASRQHSYSHQWFRAKFDKQMQIASFQRGTRKPWQSL